MTIEYVLTGSLFPNRVKRANGIDDALFEGLVLYAKYLLAWLVIKLEDGVR